MLLREFLLVGNGPFASSLQSTITMVDSLHSFPPMPKVPVAISRSRKEQGSYHYLDKPSRPVRIAISRFAVCPSWTLLHEIGHLLDHLALNPIKRGFASDQDQAFDDISALWRQSRHVQSLHRLAQTHGRFADTAARRIINSYLTSRELWARSYAQWIAMNSEDAQLLAHLEILRNEGDTFAGIRCSTQWDDDDFDVIMGAINELFKNARLV